MKHLFKLIRFPNLVIVGILQCLIYFNLLLPLLSKYGITPGFPPLEFGLFVLVTLLITGGGYIINDLVDYEADIINKEGRVILKEKIPVSIASWIYYSTMAIGFFLALFLAFFSNNLNLLWIFPAAVSGLFFYSLVLKRNVLVGNVLVAAFAGGVAGIVAIAGRQSITDLYLVAPEKADLFQLVVWIYVVFAFFSTLFREIVKDIEDIIGDKKAGFRTLPIVMGIPFSKKLGIAVGILFTFLSVSGFLWILPWIKTYFGDYWIWMIVVAIICILLELVALILLIKAREKRSYWRVSQIIKLIMVLGIIFLSFIRLDY